LVRLETLLFLADFFSIGPQTLSTPCMVSGISSRLLRLSDRCTALGRPLPLLFSQLISRDIAAFEAASFCCVEDNSRYAFPSLPHFLFTMLLFSSFWLLDPCYGCGIFKKSFPSAFRRMRPADPLFNFPPLCSTSTRNVHVNPSGWQMPLLFSHHPVCCVLLDGLTLPLMEPCLAFFPSK